MSGRFLSVSAIILLHKFSSFSVEFPYKHILIVSGSDSESNKYNILMMKMFVKVSSVLNRFTASDTIAGWLFVLG